MATLLSRKHDPASPPIPDRLYFKIGDVARICDVETYVLRFWETQFPHLKPNKSGAGQRLYRRRDVELALEIKRLVHLEGYTIAGARQALDPVQRRRTPQPPLALPESAPAQPLDNVAAVLAHARAELRDIAALLGSPISSPAPDSRPPRRRARIAPPPPTSGLLFPS